MEKDKILKLINLKIRLNNAERKHERELDHAREQGSYAYAEGYKSRAMVEIEELEKQIEEL